MKSEMIAHEGDDSTCAVAIVERELPPLNSLSIINNAIDKGVTGEQLALFVQSVERLEKMKAEKAFAAAFAACQREIPSVIKGKTNPQTNSLYAELQAIQEIIVPVYTRRGFAFSFGTEEAKTDGDIRIVATLTHSEGHSVSRFVDLPPDGAGIKGTANKTAVHARASTITYGQRYLTVLMFNIQLTTKVDNDGNNDWDTLIAEEVKDLLGLIEAKKVDRIKFLAWASEAAKKHIEKLEDMPRSLFAQSFEMLKRRKVS